MATAAADRKAVKPKGDQNAQLGTDPKTDRAKPTGKKPAPDRPQQKKSKPKIDADQKAAAKGATTKKGTDRKNPVTKVRISTHLNGIAEFATIADARQHLDNYGGYILEKPDDVQLVDYDD